MKDKYCMDPKENVNLFGLYGDIKNNSFLRINIYKCFNSSSSDNCFNNDIINNQISKSNFLLKFMDYNINNNNLTYPEYKFIKGQVFELNPFMIKTIKDWNWWAIIV